MHLVGEAGAYFSGEVPEASVSKVRPGSPVAVLVNGAKISGTVAAINPQGAEVGRIFQVRITLNSVSSDILPGMFARGIITVRSVPNAVVIPISAIVKRDGKDVVFVMENGVAKQVPITQQIKNQDKVQVDGLQIGAQLVTKGQDQLVDGSKVRLDANKTASLASSGKEG